MLALATGSPAAAAERFHRLVWRMPLGEQVAGYRVYLEAGSPGASVTDPDGIDIGHQPLDPNGIGSFLIGGLDPAVEYRVSMTAYSPDRTESLRSNTLVIDALCSPGQCLDSDADGVLDDGDGSGIAGDRPCDSGSSNAPCDDNCAYAANPGQRDAGGLSQLPPDGIGDACQCGDLTGNGIINTADLAKLRRSLASASDAGERCDVGSGCTTGDLVRLKVALGSLDPSVLQQACPPARP